MAGINVGYLSENRGVLKIVEIVIGFVLCSLLCDVWYAFPVKDHVFKFKNQINGIFKKFSHFTFQNNTNQLRGNRIALSLNARFS